MPDDYVPPAITSFDLSGRRMLSGHFCLDEMVFSTTAIRHGIDNTPSQAVIANLTALCVGILEPARAHVGPIMVNSGYRCPALNKLVGGAAHSQHMTGQAADIRPGWPQVTLNKLFSVIYFAGGFDQIIHEFSSWVHVSYRTDGPNRGECLISSRTASGVVYRPVTKDDNLWV